MALMAPTHALPDNWVYILLPALLIQGLPFSGTPALSLALNVMVDADLSDHVTHRVGNLHWIMQPDAPEWGWLVIMRMVKPWSEWIMILFQKPGWKPPHEGWLPSQAQYEKRVQDLIGDDSVPFKVTGVSKWLVNEVWADKYQEKRIICGGDAVHRHPPINGLGSNTCIQDAHNLSWKLAYVLKGTSQLKYCNPNLQVLHILRSWRPTPTNGSQLELE